MEILPQCANQVVDLARCGATHCVSDTNTVNTSPIDNPVEIQQIDEVAPEAILTAETDLNTSAAYLLALLLLSPLILNMNTPLDVVDDLDSGLLDVLHVLAVRVFPELLGGPDDQVDAVGAAIAGNLGILHGVRGRGPYWRRDRKRDSPPWYIAHLYKHHVSYHGGNRMATERD